VIYLLYAIHIIVCVFLILVVLLQQGKGADLSVFGGGSTQTAFGARSATTLLHKLTVASFVIFILTTVSIGVFQGKSGSSVVSGVGRVKGKATLPAPAAPAPVKTTPAPGAPAQAVPPAAAKPLAPTAPAPVAPPPPAH
jgi:preprotein translocase subunit SecG